MTPTNSTKLRHFRRPSSKFLEQRVRDLETAREVQQAIFPNEMQRCADWEFAGLCKPARAVAGDYYDIFQAGPDRFVIALGDVSGKGLGPALVSSAFHGAIRSRAGLTVVDLERLVEQLHRYLLAITPEETFASLFIGLLSASTGELRYVNAGHPRPVVLTSREAEPVRVAEGGTVLGILPQATFREGRRPVAGQKNCPEALSHPFYFRAIPGSSTN